MFGTEIGVGEFGFGIDDDVGCIELGIVGEGIFGAVDDGPTIGVVIGVGFEGVVEDKGDGEPAGFGGNGAERFLSVIYSNDYVADNKSTPWSATCKNYKLIENNLVYGFSTLLSSS